MTENDRPSWLHEPCPPWCSRRHQEDEHPEDRYHQSEPAVLSTVAGDGSTVPITDSLAPVDLTVRIGRHLGDPVDWVVIEALESAHPRLVLTAESAHRLVQQLELQLARRAGGAGSDAHR